MTDPMVLTEDEAVEVLAPRASPSARALLEGPLRQMPGTATKSNDPEYAAELDAVCAALAQHLVARFHAR